MDIENEVPVETGLDAGPQLVDRIAASAEWLPSLELPGFQQLFDRFGSAKIVLLGAATHGTSEFYRARAAITRHLIERHGFSIVALEADWPDAASVDRYVRDRPTPLHAEPAFRRFPTWLWRNVEFETFIEWLRAANAALPADGRTGVYGLDLYSLMQSTRIVLSFLESADPAAAVGLRTDLHNGLHVGQAVASALMRSLSGAAKGGPGKSDDQLDAERNARLVINGVAMERALQVGEAAAWNVRTTHMFETLCAILESRQPGAKAVVWAHNALIGDASATEAGTSEGRTSLGQLCRERFAAAAALIGFGTDHGTVACAPGWGASMAARTLEPAHDGSHESLARESGISRFLLDFRAKGNVALCEALAGSRAQRSIGVVCEPERHELGRYSQCCLPKQFDAYVWFAETQAVTPLPSHQAKGRGETYPFRV